MSTLDPYANPEDPFNPYTSPRSAPGLPEFMREPSASSLPFSVSAIFGRTWEIFKVQWGACLGTVVGCYALTTVAPYVLMMVLAVVGGAQMAALPGGMPGMTGGNDAAALQAGLLMLVGYFAVVILMAIFGIWIGIGQVIVLLNIARGRPAAVSDVFAGGRYMLRTTLATILLTIMTGGLFGLIMALSGGIATVLGGNDQNVIGAIMGLGAVVGCFALGYVFLRLSQFYYLIVERQAGALESLKLSVAATQGRVMGLLGLFLLAWFLNLGGAMFCLVGLLATLPFTFLLFAVAYQSLVGGPVADPAGMGKPYLPADPLFEA